MEISDILGKDGIGETIGNDGVEMLKGMQSTLDALQKKVADADAGIKSRDAQKANEKARADELQTQLDAIKESSMSEGEKMEAALKKSEEERSKLMADFTAMREEVTREKRTSQLAKIASDANFIDSLPASTASAIIESALNGVDLSDKDAVSGVLGTFMDEHKGILKGNVADGSGTHNTAPSAGKPTKLTPESLMNMSDEDYLAQKEEIFRAAGTPTI